MARRCTGVAPKNVCRARSRTEKETTPHRLLPRWKLGRSVILPAARRGNAFYPMSNRGPPPPRPPLLGGSYVLTCLPGSSCSAFYLFNSPFFFIYAIINVISVCVGVRGNFSPARPMEYGYVGVCSFFIFIVLFYLSISPNIFKLIC